MSDEHEAETPYAIVSISGVWRCANCGDVVEPTDSRARWAGDHWQHACGDPQAGHYDCRFFRADDPRDAEIERLTRERDEMKALVGDLYAWVVGYDPNWSVQFGLPRLLSRAADALNVLLGDAPTQEPADAR